MIEQIEVVRTARVPQDLHVHTVFSYNDGAIEPQQTVELVAAVRHAQVLGISDHFEHIAGDRFEPYRDAVLAHGLLLGTEVNGPDWTAEAAQAPVEYYNLHCPDTPAHYAAAERLLETGRPVIIAHPMLLGTNLDKVPPECLIEINNRYVWRNDWRMRLTPYVNRFRFVIGSDAHQPHWLNQNTARWVATQLGVRETILFPERFKTDKEETR